jgi:hypothetical protein
MKRRGRVGVVVAGASALLSFGGCTRAPRPEPSPVTPSPTTADAATADTATDEVVDLEALIADPAAALPGALVRRGRYDFRRLRGKGAAAVAMTEELEIHALGERRVGRIARKGERSPPSLLVFLTDHEGRLAQLIWRGLPGTGDVEHEFSEITARSDGPSLEIVRKRGLNTSIQRVTVAGAWTLDVALALELLPLWSAAATARPEQAPPEQAPPEQVEWVSIRTSPGTQPERVSLARRGKETLTVGGHEVVTWRYQPAGSAPLSAMIWVDDEGLVVRSLEQEAGEGGTQWDTIYVPLTGDRLLR